MNLLPRTSCAYKMATLLHPIVMENKE